MNKRALDTDSTFNRWGVFTACITASILIVIFSDDWGLIWLSQNWGVLLLSAAALAAVAIIAYFVGWRRGFVWGRSSGFLEGEKQAMDWRRK